MSIKRVAIAVHHQRGSGDMTKQFAARRRSHQRPGTDVPDPMDGSSDRTLARHLGATSPHRRRPGCPRRAGPRRARRRTIDDHGRRGSEQGKRLGSRTSVTGFARARHHGGHRQQPMRLLDGHDLHDHAAHRQAHHMSVLDPERVQYGHARRAAMSLTVYASPCSPTGAVSNFDDMPTSRLSNRTTCRPLGDEHRAPVLVVVDALTPQAVDEEQRRVVGIPERLVVDLATAVLTPSPWRDGISTVPHVRTAALCVHRAVDLLDV